MKEDRRGLAQRAAALLPETLLAVPERVLVNVACVLIGVSAMIPPEGSIIAEWSPWRAWSWAVTLILGAMFSLHGTFTGDRVSERVGALALLLGCWYYAASVTYERGASATIPALIFFFIGAAKLLRLIRSTAWQQRARQAGWAADPEHRDRHGRATGDQA